MAIHQPTSEKDFITPQYALVYLHRGKGWYADDRGRSRIEPGDVFQRFPGHRHQVHMETPTVRCYIAVPSQVFELLQLMGIASVDRPVLKLQPCEERHRAFEDILNSLSTCEEGELAPVLLKMQGLIWTLHGEARLGQFPADRDPSISKAAQLLSQDFAVPLRLAEFARQLGMNYNTFRKRFAAETGSSPGDYRIRRRIERAMVLISQTRLPHREIAGQLGYSDEYAFSAQFKKLTGLSPLEFKRVN
ncbi:MAG: helix-turn-helix transcriptional regulator [Planctomycetes bacterium]|nr:helix-turn-helix transcriptional regulator [Planctomycetota bacterium]